MGGLYSRDLSTERESKRRWREERDLFIHSIQGSHLKLQGKRKRRRVIRCRGGEEEVVHIHL